MPKQLQPFEGQEVVSAGIEIPSAGGGLHDALRVQPRQLHLGDEVYVVLHLRTKKVRFDPVKDSDTELSRVHVMAVDEATFVSEELVAQNLADQRARIDELKAAEEEAEGVQRLPFSEAHALPDASEVPTGTV